MGLTTYTPDIHGNLDYVRAHNTVTNYLGKKHNLKLSSVCPGDFSKDGEIQLSKSGMSLEEITANKIKDNKILNKEFENFNGKIYGILGNHDSEGTKKELRNVNFIDFKSQKINGKTHYGIKHSSANLELFGGNPEEDNYKSLESKFDKIEKDIKKADVVVMHEGVKGLSYNGKGKTKEDGSYNQRLAKVIEENNISYVCGHVHSSKTEINKKSYGLRTGTSNAKGSTFFRLNCNGKDEIYEMKNSDLMKWANEINPKEDFKFIDDKIPENKEIPDTQEFEKEFTEYIGQKYPDYLKQMANYENEYLNQESVNEKNIDPKHMAKFMLEKDPDFVNKQKKILNEFVQNQTLKKTD